MDIFKAKYSHYGGYRSFTLAISPIKARYELKYFNNQTGGSTKLSKINKVLENFKKYNIAIDELEIGSPEIRIEFYTIDSKNICFAVFINYETKVATI